MRSTAQLLATDDPAWPTVEAWIAAAPVSVKTLPVTAAARESCLYRLQVTTRSTLGAMAWNTGGLLIDHGWLRLLGGGSSGLIDLATASGLGEPSSDSSPPPFVVAGFDILGGKFAINGGGLPGSPGHIAYFAPDTLDWTSLELGHSQFVEWCLTGDMATFYANLRWDGWEVESSALALTDGLTVFPPLFTQEAQANIAATARAAVPWQELMDVQDHLASQMKDIPDGQTFRIQAGGGEPARKKRRWSR